MLGVRRIGSRLRFTTLRIVHSVRSETRTVDTNRQQESPPQGEGGSSLRPVHRRRWASEPACDVNETRCHPNDALWARRAHERGYDSVQLLAGADQMPELLVTTSTCLSQTKPIGTCPPVPLRTGEAASKGCECSEQSVVLNCARGARALSSGGS